jgi:hypothetical protein
MLAAAWLALYADAWTFRPLRGVADMLNYRGVELCRPKLTRDQVEAFQVGDRVRNIPGDPFEIVALVDGKNNESLAVMAFWHARHQCWRHVVAPAWELEILYTPHAYPKGKA